MHDGPLELAISGRLKEVCDKKAEQSDDGGRGVGGLENQKNANVFSEPPLCSLQISDFRCTDSKALCLHGFIHVPD